MLKNIYFGFIFVFYCSNAIAEWTLIYENLEKESKYYVDLDSIIKKNNSVRIITLEDYRIPIVLKKESFKLSYNSVKSLAEFNCSNNSVRVLSYSVYDSQMANSDPLMSKGTPFDWEKININTVNSAYLNIACNE